MVVFHQAFGRLSNHTINLYGRCFNKAFEKAELAGYGQEDLERYESSLKVFRGNKAVFDYTKQTAFNEGKREVARNMKMLGVENDMISKSTGLTEEEITHDGNSGQRPINKELIIKS